MSSRPSRGAARLASILDALPDALLLVNANGTVVNANAIALETFETPGTALVGRGLLDLLPGFDPKRIPGSMRSPQEAAEDTRTKPTRMTARRTDGTEFPVQVTSANLDDSRTPYADYGDGMPHYTGDELLMLVVRDLSGTVDTEAELARQQRQTEMILRAAAEGVVGVDTAGKVVLVNPSAAQILGHRATDLGGKELHPLVHHSRPDGSPLAYEETPLADTLRSGRKHRVRGQVLWRKDGRAVPVDLTTAPVRDGDQLVGAVMTFTDRTQYDALAARNGQLRALLDTSLRGPLAELRGELTGLAADPAGQLWPEANQILHHLAAGYARITTLIDNVLDFQRLDRGDDKLRREAVGIDEVVAAAVEGAVELIGPGRAQFAVHAGEIEAVVDGPRLAQALAHLVADVAGIDAAGNAMAFAGDSTIVVAAAQRGEMVRIDVRGPSAGGDPVHLPLARGIIERHGGVLQTHEVPGQGSAYVLEVPLGAVPDGTPENTEGSGAEGAGAPVHGRRAAHGRARSAESGTGGTGAGGTAPGVPGGGRAAARARQAAAAAEASSGAAAEPAEQARAEVQEGAQDGAARQPRHPDDTGTVVAPWAIPAAADQSEAPTGRRRALRRPGEDGSRGGQGERAERNGPGLRSVPSGESAGGPQEVAPQLGPQVPQPGPQIPQQVPPNVTPQIPHQGAQQSPPQGPQPTGRRARRGRPAEEEPQEEGELRELPVRRVPHALPSAGEGDGPAPQGAPNPQGARGLPAAPLAPGQGIPSTLPNSRAPQGAPGRPAGPGGPGNLPAQGGPNGQVPQGAPGLPVGPTGLGAPGGQGGHGPAGQGGPGGQLAQGAPGLPVGPSGPGDAAAPGGPSSPAAPGLSVGPGGGAPHGAPGLPGGPTAFGDANSQAPQGAPGVPVGPAGLGSPGRQGGAQNHPGTPDAGAVGEQPQRTGRRARRSLEAAPVPGLPYQVGPGGGPAATAWPQPGAEAPQQHAQPQEDPRGPRANAPALAPAAQDRPALPAPQQPTWPDPERPALQEAPAPTQWPQAGGPLPRPQNGPHDGPQHGQQNDPRVRPAPNAGPSQDPSHQTQGRAISVRTLGQGVPYGDAGDQTPTQAAQAQHPQGLPAQVAAGGSGRRRRLAAPQEGPSVSALPLVPSQPPVPGGESLPRQHPQAGPDSGQVPVRTPEGRETARLRPVPAEDPNPQPGARAYAIGAPAAGAAEGPEPLDGPNGAVDVTDTMEQPRIGGEEAPLDEPRRLLVWPEPDVSTRQALTDRGYRPVIVRSREEVDAQVAEPPAALFVDPLTGPITRTALQSLRQAAAAAEVPVLVTAGLGQATREAAYGADPAVLLKALAPRDSEQHPPRVLLVEGHDPIAMAFAGTLERRGMQVTHADSEADAMTKAAQIHPNLVVMDLMLIRRRRQGIVDWLRGHSRLNTTPLVVYTSADIDPAELPRLASGETVLFLAERSTSADVQSRIVDLLGKIGA